MQFKDIVISFVFLALFTVAFISFTYQMTYNNNPTSALLSDQRINKTLSSSFSALNNFSTTSGTQMNQSNSETITGGAFGLISFAIIGSVRNFGNVITGTYTIITTLLIETIHINPIILNIILGIIMVVLIFSAWRIYRQGQ
jgi:hypothetical protein